MVESYILLILFISFSILDIKFMVLVDYFHNDNMRIIILCYLIILNIINYLYLQNRIIPMDNQNDYCRINQ